MTKVNKCLIFSIINNYIKNIKSTYTPLQLPIYLIMNKEVMLLKYYKIELTDTEINTNINSLNILIYNKYLDYLKKLIIYSDNVKNIQYVTDSTNLDNIIKSTCNDEFNKYMKNNNLCGNISFK